MSTERNKEVVMRLMEEGFNHSQEAGIEEVVSPKVHSQEEGVSAEGAGAEGEAGLLSHGPSGRALGGRTHPGRGGQGHDLVELDG